MSKKFKLKIAIIWLLIVTTSLSIPGCRKLDQDHLGKKCTHCYNSSLNDFGSCTPRDIKCQGNDVKSCLKCLQEGYYLSYPELCYSLSAAIPNCVSSIIFHGRYFLHERCRACLDGYPTRTTQPASKAHHSNANSALGTKRVLTQRPQNQERLSLPNIEM